MSEIKQDRSGDTLQEPQKAFLFYDLNLEYILGSLAQIQLLVEQRASLEQIASALTSFRDGLRSSERMIFESMLEWHRKQVTDP